MPQVSAPTGLYSLCACCFTASAQRATLKSHLHYARARHACYQYLLFAELVRSAPSKHARFTMLTGCDPGVQTSMGDEHSQAYKTQCIACLSNFKGKMTVAKIASAIQYGNFGYCHFASDNCQACTALGCVKLRIQGGDAS